MILISNLRRKKGGRKSDDLTWFAAFSQPIPLLPSLPSLKQACLPTGRLP